MEWINFNSDSSGLDYNNNKSLIHFDLWKIHLKSSIHPNPIYLLKKFGLVDSY